MRKSVRLIVVICICAALFVCAVAPAYASGTAEYQTYTDYFDSSTASVSYSAKVYMLIIDPNGGFQKHNYSSTVKVEGDNLVCLSAGQVRDFLSSVNAFVEEKGVELENCRISVGVKLDSLYSAHAVGTAFPFAAYQYNLTAFGTNLNFNSLQGDKAIVKLLEEFGSIIEVYEENGVKNSVGVKQDLRKGIIIDANNIPDLVPILALVASVSNGITRIINASRLRLKESD